MESSLISVIGNILVCLAVIMCLFYWYQTKNYSYWKDLGVPYIEPHVLFGSFKDSITGIRSWPRYCRDLYTNYKDNRIVGTYTFRQPSVFIIDPQLIERILVQDFVHFQDRGVPHHDPLFSSPFYMQGQQWRDLRLKMLPAFTSKKVKGMFDQVSQSADQLLRNIDETNDTEAGTELEGLLFEFTTDVITACAFGFQLRDDPELWQEFLRTYNSVTALSTWRTSKELLSMLYPRLSQWIGLSLNDKSVTEFFFNLTRSSIKYREHYKVNRPDFLQLLLTLKQRGEDEMTVYDDVSLDESRTKRCTRQVLNVKNNFRRCFDNFFQSKSQSLDSRRFTENCIASLMFSFTFAGVQLEYGVLGFTLYELAKTPSIQKRLQNEIDECSSRNRGLNYDAIRDMKYLDEVLQETLRMYPLTPVILREVTTPYKLPGTEVTLLEGMFVLIPHAAIHMDPNYYPSPQTFNPDRFKDNNYRPSSVYLPFGQGPRMCFAIKFAILVMKVCIAKIMSKYHVKFGSKMELPLLLDETKRYVKSKNGIWLSFYPRYD